MTRSLRHLLLIAMASTLVGGVAAPPAWGQSAVADKLQRDLKAYVEAQADEGRGIVFKNAEGGADLDPTLGRVTLTGPNAELRIGDSIRLFADGIVLWGPFPKEGPLADRLRPEGIDAIYAEGDVHLSIFGDSLEAEAVLIRLDGELPGVDAIGLTFRAASPETTGNGRPWASEGRPDELTWRLDQPGEAGSASKLSGEQSLGYALRSGTLLLHAGRARFEGGLATLVAEDVEVSTCTFHQPHWSMATDRAEITRGADGGAGIRLARPRLNVLGTEVFRWPFDIPWHTDFNDFVPKVRYEKSGRFGQSIQSVLPIVPRGDVKVHGLLDYFSKRGVGYGVEASVSKDLPFHDEAELTGEAEYYRIDDRGVDQDGFDPPGSRYKADAFLRLDVGRTYRVEGELGLVSDQGFLTEYFEREARAEKEKETVLYGRLLGHNTMLSAQWRNRLIQEQEQVEYLPGARFAWTSEPWLQSVLPFDRAVYASLDYQLSNARRRFARGTAPASEQLDERVLRADFDHRFDLPITLGPAQLAPFFETRVSAFSEAIDPDDEPVRTALAGGAVLTTDAWRDIDVAIEALGVSGFRHVVTPFVGYEHAFLNTVEPIDLIPLDEVEQVAKAESIVFGVRNRLVARLDDEVRTRHELLDLDLRATYFPRPKLSGGRSWGLLSSDARLEPVRRWALRAKSDFDIDKNLEHVRTDITASFLAHEQLLLYGSYRYTRGSFESTSAGLDLRATEKWAFAASTQYNFRVDDFIDNRLSVRRYFHRFVVEVSIEADFGEDEVRFGLDFRPIELLSTLRGGPRLGETGRYLRN
ncbi:MAG: LPS-assembly protein LptD [Planctomycetota bacterium]